MSNDLGPPRERERPGATTTPGLSEKSGSPHHLDQVDYVTGKELVWVPCTWRRTEDLPGQLRNRRAASWRMERLACGRSDPWSRQFDPDPSERNADGYSAAAQHLLDAGLLPAANVPALRVMWRHGGHEQRLAREIAEGWGMVA
jgi:hypothetical protein